MVGVLWRYIDLSRSDYALSHWQAQLLLTQGWCHYAACDSFRFSDFCCI